MYSRDIDSRYQNVTRYLYLIKRLCCIIYNKTTCVIAVIKNNIGDRIAVEIGRLTGFLSASSYTFDRLISLDTKFATRDSFTWGELCLG